MKSRIGDQEGYGEVAPTVSILVATYNHVGFVSRCLDSILAQETSFPVEIIIHDDASTDGTQNVIETYAGRFPGHIRTVLQTVNQRSRGRNTWPPLHKIATGQFIAYCDGDDYWVNPHKLSIQVGFLTANPEFALSFHDAIQVNEDGLIIESDNRLPAGKRDYSSEELRTLRWGGMLFGTMVHRNLRLEFPPEYDLVVNGDNFMPILHAPYGGAKYIESAGPLAYRQHGGGEWSSLTDRKKVIMHLQTYLQITSYLIRTGDYRAARQIITGRLDEIVRAFLRMNPR